MLIGIPIINLSNRKEGFIIRIVSEKLFIAEYADGTEVTLKTDEAGDTWDYN